MANGNRKALNIGFIKLEIASFLFVTSRPMPLGLLFVAADRSVSRAREELKRGVRTTSKQSVPRIWMGLEKE